MAIGIFDREGQCIVIKTIKIEEEMSDVLDRVSCGGAMLESCNCIASKREMPGRILAGCDARMKSGDGSVDGLIGDPVVLEEGSENGYQVGGQDGCHVACPEKVCAGAM